jgi:hypothetical protein
MKALPPAKIKELTQTCTWSHDFWEAVLGSAGMPGAKR